MGKRRQRWQGDSSTTLSLRSEWHKKRRLMFRSEWHKKRGANTPLKMAVLCISTLSFWNERSEMIESLSLSSWTPPCLSSWTQWRISTFTSFSFIPTLARRAARFFGCAQNDSIAVFRRGDSRIARNIIETNANNNKKTERVYAFGFRLKSGNYLSSQGLAPSTFGVKELNFCVRNGNRWILFAIITAMVYIRRFQRLYQRLTTT